MKKTVYFTVLFATFSTLCGFLSVSQAHILDGQDNPEFELAVELWLDDNDAESLPLLAALAQGENAAARLLLARIESTDRAFSDFVRDLSRRDRMEIFRAPNQSGVFYPSWLRVESDNGLRLARVLLRSTALGIDLATIQQLIDLGEGEAAEHLIRKVAVDGSAEQRDSLLNALEVTHELYPYLLGFQFSHAGQTTGRTALQNVLSQTDVDNSVLESNDDTKMAELFLDMGYQAGDQVVEYTQGAALFEYIAQWLDLSAHAVSIKTICDNACLESERAVCKVTSLGLVGGYYELIRFDSPLESIITQDEFMRSRRARGMTLRKIKTARTEADVPVFTANELMEKSECLADVIASYDSYDN
ncbi:MAG: hypothetical protein AAF434_09450 [Pseudomonadota bacterium]